MNIKDDPNLKIVSEKFPRIALGIEVRWGTKDLEPYVTNLLNDTRDHTRKGFPDEIATALSALLLTHDNEFPQFREPLDSIWQANYFS